MLNNIQMIDNVFYPLYYRYIPFDLRTEWHKVYQNYATDYYNKSKKNIMNPQTLIDIYNEEKDKLSVLKKKVDNFSKKIPRIIPMYSSDKEYTEKVKKSLSDSMNKINNFINFRNKKLNDEMGINKVEVRKSIDNFNQSEYSSNNYILITFFIVILVICIIICYFI